MPPGADCVLRGSACTFACVCAAKWDIPNAIYWTRELPSHPSIPHPSVILRTQSKGKRHKVALDHSNLLCCSVMLLHLGSAEARGKKPCVCVCVSPAASQLMITSPASRER